MQENLTEIQKILLIDIDNCPSEINNIIGNSKIYSRIVICYGGQVPKVSLNLLCAFADMMNEKKLEIIGMQKKGKNAADFGLCFLAGRLSQQITQAEFIILSNDTDLDHAVNLLQTVGHSAQRIGTMQENQTVTEISPLKHESKSITNEIIELAQDYYQHHLNATIKKSQARPAKKETLLNSIRAFSQKKMPNVEVAIFDYLHSKGYFRISASGKVEY
ncbi:Protein of unknown function DUF88 [Beggiatoa alba B18LD]|uniref:PIN-like domain-containing protein n=1 Tax=Beggiatoa alba B18LD TaxID=395493 RepID=I3CEQ5_9GAMM|nr:PIN domain-containing protein [Beggiatoa alba]EIJ42098.1 Protein of unknown function DUF88 [Beggiatoa alba B18LD]